MSLNKPHSSNQTLKIYGDSVLSKISFTKLLDCTNINLSHRSLMEVDRVYEVQKSVFVSSFTWQFGELLVVLELITSSALLNTEISPFYNCRSPFLAARKAHNVIPN